jgi:diguanylate cyclase (GGDEF)-like protein
MRLRISLRHDGSLLAGLALALLTVFDPTIGRTLQFASEVEAAYHVRLLPALVVLVGLLIVHLLTRRHELKAKARAAATEAKAAQERARDLELLATFGRALAGVLTDDALRAALWRHLPLIAGRSEVWVALGESSRIATLLDTTGNATTAVTAEETSRRVLSGRAGHDDPVGVVDGRYRCFAITAAGRPLGVIGVLNKGEPIDDRTARLLNAASALLGIAVRNVQLFTETRENALTDSLTQCFNRGHIMQVIEAELRRARRTRSPLSVVMLDIDQFKTMNDRAGHLGGDAILSAIGNRLRAVLRHSDVRGRFGGDEFLILLPDTPAAGAAYVAESLRREIEDLAVPVEGFTASVSASVGVATARPDEMEPAALVARVDRALYAAKEAGRNRVVSADADIATTASLARALRAS